MSVAISLRHYIPIYSNGASCSNSILTGARLFVYLECHHIPLTAIAVFSFEHSQEIRSITGQPILAQIRSQRMLLSTRLVGLFRYKQAETFSPETSGRLLCYHLRRSPLVLAPIQWVRTIVYHEI